MASVTYCDTTATGKILRSWTLPDLPDRITVRELVQLRVRDEVARFNADPCSHLRALVQPRGAEADCDACHLPHARRLDWKVQADIAEKAFGRNGFFILVDDRQVESLDDLVDLTRDPEVAFVKLVPLVGG